MKKVNDLGLYSLLLAEERKAVEEEINYMRIKADNTIQKMDRKLTERLRVYDNVIALVDKKIKEEEETGKKKIQEIKEKYNKELKEEKEKQEEKLEELRQEFKEKKKEEKKDNKKEEVDPWSF